MAEQHKYIILTPAGVLFAFSNAEPTEQQQALQVLLPSTATMTVQAWSDQYSQNWLEMFSEQGFVELVEKPIVAPNVNLDSFLKYVSASLSGSRKVAIGTGTGTCLSYIGYSQKEAYTLCDSAFDLVEFFNRQQKREWTVLGKAVSFHDEVDMIMPHTNFVYFWVGKRVYWVIIDDEPLLNSRAFVQLVWGVKIHVEKEMEQTKK